MNRRAFLSVAILLASLGCQREVELCRRYSTIATWVKTFAYPALDVAATIFPEVAAPYFAARAIVDRVDAAIIAECERVEKGDAVDEAYLRGQIAEGATALAELARLYHGLTGKVQGVRSIISADPEWKSAAVADRFLAEEKAAEADRLAEDARR